MTLLAIPNVSEGRDAGAIDAIGAAFDARLLDVHSDPDHHRTVFTLAGEPGRLAHAVLARRRARRSRRIDLDAPRGDPPARRRARRRADRLPRPGATAAPRAPRRSCSATCSATSSSCRCSSTASSRGGGRAPSSAAAARRARAADRGRRARARTSARAGSTRPPARCSWRRARRWSPSTSSSRRRRRSSDAQAIAARDPRGRRRRACRASARSACGSTRRDVAQVSTNVEDHRATPLASVVAAIARHAAAARGRARRPRPAAAFDGFPDDLPVANRARRATLIARSPQSRVGTALSSIAPWLRPSASAAPSTAATPPGRSRRAGRTGRPPTRRGAQEADRGAGARAAAEHAADLEGRRSSARALAAVLMFVFLLLIDRRSNRIASGG